MATLRDIYRQACQCQRLVFCLGAESLIPLLFRRVLRAYHSSSAPSFWDSIRR